MGLRNRRIDRLAPLALAVGLAWAAGPASGQELSGPEVAKRFIERQYEMTPVTGEFVITAKHQPLNPVQQAKKEAAGWKGPPPESVTKCRWAFDRDREVLDTLPGSTGFYNRCYIGPEGLVLGMSSDSRVGNYVLDKVRNVPVTRPGSFFFLGAGNERWETTLAEPGVKPAAVKSGDATVLSVDGASMRYELTLDSDTLLLRSARASMKGEQVWSLEIRSYVRDPGGRKVFPKEATQRLVDPSTKRLLREEHLTAVSVEFPKGQGTGAAFTLTLPPKSLVGDQLLNRAIIIDKPTDAASLIANPTQAKTQAYDQDIPGLAVESEPEVPYTPGGWLTLYWAVALSVVAAVAVYVVVRRLMTR